MRKVLLFTLCLLICSDFNAANKSKIITSIPFEMVGSYVVIRVKINDSSPLQLILDSGIRNTIITELQEGDRMTLNYSDVKDLMGLGGGNHLEAYSSNFNTLKIGRLEMKTKTVLVLKDDVFNLSRHTGTKINGLIGVDFFQDYIVEVNYSSKRIIFYDRNSFFAPKGYENLPLEVEGQKMFVQLSVLETDTVKRTVKMLIDTGAELNAWFQTYKNESVHMPVKSIRGTIGQGLNGEIVGKIGRLPVICFGNHCLQSPIVSFPDSSCIADIIGNSDRDGTIGSQILSRFHYIIDYQNKQFYFRPNSNFSNKFTYNVAGIEVTQIFPLLPMTEVWRIWEQSPAAKVGIQIGDQIMELNGKNSFELNINDIKGIFQTPSKLPLQITVQREGKELKFQIDMKDKL